MAEMSKYARLVRGYEISIWTLQDKFLSVLKWATQDHKGQIQDPKMTIRDDGTQELSFVIPKFYWIGPEKIQNPMWLHLEDQPLEANMHKLKVIFNKNSSDEKVFEFLVTSVAHDHSDDRVELTVKAEGLAYHELGKIGYKINLSQETYTTAFDNWVDNGMVDDQPEENIQFWNDLIFKDSKGKWKGNWKYEIQMDWSSYSYQDTRQTDKIYEDEYVSSWQVEDGKLSPRAIEVYKEKWRPVEVKESNLYNVTQTIAEQFGVFCRYEYEHDENYQLLPEQYDEEGNIIPTRKVIYYNNYYCDADGHIDLTYPYSSSAITRTVDNSNIVTKMYVPTIEYENEDVSIINVEANKSKEDYLLDFEYLHDVQAITEEQYAEIEKYEAAMHIYNSTLYNIQERIRVLENQLIETSARVTTLINALKLDEEQEAEAARLLRGVRGGSEDLPIRSALTAITAEGTHEDWKQYVTVTRWEGINPESIHLYENSHYNMGYSDDISFIIRRDENGEITHLSNLGRTADDHEVFIQATYNPYDYYKRMEERWKTRETLDEQDLAAAELEEAKINWYLHGSRVGYGVVGGIIMGETTYPVGITMYDEPWDTEDLSRSDRAGEMRVVGTNEEGLEWQAADPPKPDPFLDLDLTSTTPDLYYTLQYYLEEKAAKFNAFEKMMGPAMREGYWQPDNYHDYGDQYHDNITVSKIAGEVPGNAPSPTTPYIEWKWDYEKYYTNETPVLYRVGVETRPNPHLILNISNCLDVIREHLNDLSFIYADPETMRAINSLEIEISDLKGTVKNEAINETIVDETARQKSNLCWLSYDAENQIHIDYFNTIPGEDNDDFKPLYTSLLPEEAPAEEEQPSEDDTSGNTQSNPAEGYADIGTQPESGQSGSAGDTNAAMDDTEHLNNPNGTIDNSSSSNNESSTDESSETEAKVDEVTQKLEETRLSLLSLYEALNIKIQDFANKYSFNANPNRYQFYTDNSSSEYLEQLNGRLDDLTALMEEFELIIKNENNPPILEKSSGRITWCNKQIELIQQVYDSIEQYVYLPLTRATKWIPTSVKILEDNIYNIYQIGADCELGWVRVSQPIQGDNEGHDEKIVGYEEEKYFPALFITGASGLSDDELNYIMTGWYPSEELNVFKERYEDGYIKFKNEYSPFLGLYNVDIIDTETENGIIKSEAKISVEKLYKISWKASDTYEEALNAYINSNINETSIFIDGLRRNETVPESARWEMEDYDGVGIKRWITDDEYGIKRVFPRIYFSTLKLKNNSSDLKIILNDVLLENNTHYYTVQDDRSLGLKVQGIGYYTTIKPEVLYKMLDNIGYFKIVYTVSNVDTAIYLDALKVMRENAKPKISYDVELSILNPDFIHTAYNRLNQIVYINDNDLNLDDVSGYISSVTMELDKPWEDQVEVKNYETKFEDLFSTIVAQTEAMKKSSGGITAALQAFSTNGLIDGDVLQGSLSNTDLNLNFDSGDGDLSISKDGIIGTSSKGIVAYRGGGIFTATMKDSNGNWIWNTGITPSGINANLITAGQLDTNRIKIYAGDEVRFQFNGDGLFAYKPFVVADKWMAEAIADKNYTPPANGIDSSQYVIYNSDGLALIAREGTWYKDPNSNINERGQITNEWKYKQTTAEEIKRVEISWNGLILRNWENEEVFYADPDTGNLTLKGQIEATSGKIAGWIIGEDSLSSNHITIISNDNSAGIYLTRDRGAGEVKSISYIEENGSIVKQSEAIQLYGYTYKNNNVTQYCYYQLKPEEDTAPPTIKYNSEEYTLYTIVISKVGVKPKYYSEDTDTHIIRITNEADTPFEYEDNVIEYNEEILSWPVPENNNWYNKFSQIEGFEEYVNYYYDSVAIKLDPIVNGTVLTLIDFEPTFQVRALDGEAIINKGTFGTLVSDDNGMSGVLTHIELSLDNYAMVERAESENENKLEPVELGRCFYDSKYDKSTGKLTLIRLDGTTVEYKVSSGSSSSSSSSCSGCTSSCSEGCASGCATQCGQQCASSCAGKCRGTCKNQSNAIGGKFYPLP